MFVRYHRRCKGFTQMRMHSSVVGLVIACSVLALVEPAHAQQPTAADKAAADALFVEARQLLKDGNAAAACPKFEEIQRIDPGVGAGLNLGDCFERIGRTASAHVAFGDAAALARRLGETESAKEADDRAKALVPKLVKLAVNLPETSRVKGLEVFRDGTPLAPSLWGTPIAVDPGEHVVEARAPDRVPWRSVVVLKAPGDVRKLDIPKLDVIVRPPPPEKTAQRVAGIVIGSVGIAAFGVSAGFSIAAVEKDDASKPYCLTDDPNKCFAKGVALRNESIAYADAATIAAISGGVVLATGLTLVILARAPKPANEPAHAWFVVPYALPRSAGMTFVGVF